MLGRIPVTCELFKIAFQDRFFARKIREANVYESIPLKKGSIKIRENSLKFVKLFSYVISLVSKSIEDFSKELTKIWKRSVVLRCSIITCTSPC